MSKEYFLIKSDVYPVPKCYEQECQRIIISKSQISVAYNLFTISIISIFFYQKGG